MIQKLGIRVSGIQCHQAIVMIELPKRSQTSVSILWGEQNRHHHTKQVAPVGKETLNFFSALLGQKKKKKPVS